MVYTIFSKKCWQILRQSTKHATFLCLLCSTPGGGGHSHWKGVWGCAAVMTPFFQASRGSLAYQFTVNAPFLWLPFSIKIFCIFTMFWPKFLLSRPKFFKILFPRPQFFNENPLPRPYILKPVWHTSTKTKLSASPGCSTPQRICQSIGKGNYGITCISLWWLKSPAL